MCLDALQLQAMQKRGLAGRLRARAAAGTRVQDLTPEESAAAALKRATKLEGEAAKALREAEARVLDYAQVRQMSSGKSLQC